MNYNLTLNDANGLSWDIFGEPGVCYLDIENKDTSTGNLFMGDEQVGQVDMVTNTQSGIFSFDYPANIIKNGIEVGMTVGGHISIQGGTMVRKIEERDAEGIVRIYLTKAPTASNSQLPIYFNNRPLDDLNGITLVPGQRREMTSVQGNAFLDRTIRLYALTGTQCDVVIRRGKR